MPLTADLKALGMKTAFDDPPGSANFGRMATHQPNEYFALNAILHRTFLLVDEKGTEAAEATGIEASALADVPKPKPVIPIVVRVDRPFVFAIQHVPSGACIFIGRVTDPR
jgi:serpin B